MSHYGDEIAAKQRVVKGSPGGPVQPDIPWRIPTSNWREFATQARWDPWHYASAQQTLACEK